MSFTNVLAIFGHNQVDFTTTHMEKNTWWLPEKAKT